MMSWHCRCFISGVINGENGSPLGSASSQVAAHVLLRKDYLAAFSGLGSRELRFRSAG